MAQDVNLLIAIAGIAGTFVGFGALISVTRRTEIEFSLLAHLRAVVSIGLVVIVAALVPVVLATATVSSWSQSMVFMQPYFPDSPMGHEHPFSTKTGDQEIHHRPGTG